MSRIVYILPNALPTGGQKMIVRHVEALTELGLNAVVRLEGGAPKPSWVQHKAPLEQDAPLADDDILVLPEDTPGLLKQFAFTPYRKVVFCQNHFYAPSGLGRLAPEEMLSYGDVLACSETVAGWAREYLPHARTAVVPAFADERRFHARQKSQMIALTPRKRPLEANFIRYAFARRYKGETEFRWAVLQNATEEQVVDVFARSAVFLSLSRLEGLGITPLEAMASGCVVAGFTGIGGREYATADNGFWADEDDCEAATRALLAAVDLVLAGGSRRSEMLAGARRTAERWSYRNFVPALDQFWRTQLDRH